MMLKKKVLFLSVSFLSYTFLLLLGLSIINFLFKYDIFSDKPDFYKSIWIVITTTVFSGSVVLILKMKDSSLSSDITQDMRQHIEKLYSEKEFIWNRRVTLAYGVTFLFLFFAIIVSEILSFFFDEGLMSPVQLAFHTTAFVGYLTTFRYIWKNQDYIEYKSRIMAKSYIDQEKEDLERF
ncbi:MAG: hypothetical protein N2Z80_04435 [Hydrogenothermaceae bacterium]|nr:hypothetical protein [Hydrogenothermaceae bacterium]